MGCHGVDRVDVGGDVLEKGNILEVKNLSTYFRQRDQVIKAVDDVSFSIKQGQVLGLVGESGCGKTVTARSIIQLLPSAQAYIAGGQVFFRCKDGREIELTGSEVSEKDMRNLRGPEIAMIFQEPMAHLNPVFTVGYQIGESLARHRHIKQDELQREINDALKAVRIPNPSRIRDSFPFELSGGMCQRVMIAMALCCRPQMLIADEPTTALDVTIQAQILRLMKELQEEYGMAVLYISHDMGVIAENADEVAVMYLGNIVEQAPVKEIFRAPLHPYTQGLLKSIPRLGATELATIPGEVPGPSMIPSGCRFVTRCKKKRHECEKQMPPATVEDGHMVRCWLYR